MSTNTQNTTCSHLPILNIKMNSPWVSLKSSCKRNNVKLYTIATDDNGIMSIPPLSIANTQKPISIMLYMQNFWLLWSGQVIFTLSLFYSWQIHKKYKTSIATTTYIILTTESRMFAILVKTWPSMRKSNSRSKQKSAMTKYGMWAHLAKLKS